VVYVDSGSSDGSPQQAESLGGEGILLEESAPYTAARARNAVLKRLNETWPELRYVQIVDGDCIVVSGWLDIAQVYLNGHEKVAAVCGRRRERHPKETIYNQLCDIEWDTPIGEATGFGGDAMVRVSALCEVKGYRNGLIAAEDTEQGRTY
jgi:glycosyltransferase involved in cell wall biosynthesis